VKQPALAVAPPTPEWAAFVKHVAGCRVCRDGQACGEGEQLRRAHLATRG
jgi:hypothetical protein